MAVINKEGLNHLAGGITRYSDGSWRAAKGITTPNHSDIDSQDRETLRSLHGLTRFRRVIFGLVLGGVTIGVAAHLFDAQTADAQQERTKQVPGFEPVAAETIDNFEGLDFQLGNPYSDLGFNDDDNWRDVLSRLGDINRDLDSNLPHPGDSTDPADSLLGKTISINIDEPGDSANMAVVDEMEALTGVNIRGDLDPTGAADWDLTVAMGLGDKDLVHVGDQLNVTLDADDVQELEELGIADELAQALNPSAEDEPVAAGESTDPGTDQTTAEVIVQVDTGDSEAAVSDNGQVAGSEDVQAAPDQNAAGPAPTPTLVDFPTPSGSETPTPMPATVTPSATPHPTPTSTPVLTDFPTPSESVTPMPPTVTPSATPHPTPTSTPELTDFPTPTDSVTPMPPTVTPSKTPHPTPTATETATPTPTSTETPTVTPTETPTVTPTETPTATPTPTSTETPTATPTVTATLIPPAISSPAPTSTPAVLPPSGGRPGSESGWGWLAWLISGATLSGVLAQAERARRQRRRALLLTNEDDDDKDVIIQNSYEGR